MKSFIALSFLAYSFCSFAGVIRMVGVQECSSTVKISSSEEAQRAALLKCAEGRAHSELSKKCRDGWLLESEIAQRNEEMFVDANGRTMTVSAMAVGRCEF